MASEGSETSGQAEEGLFAEKVEEKEKETPKGWTPFGMEEEVDGVLGTVAKTLPPRLLLLLMLRLVLLLLWRC